MGDFIGERWYSIENNSYPSVTTILGALPDSAGFTGFKTFRSDWREIMRKAACIGTILHYRVEDYYAKVFDLPPADLFLGDEDSKPPIILTEADLDAIEIRWSYFLEWVQAFDPKPIYIEKPVHSRRYGYAGTADFYGILRRHSTLDAPAGTIWLVDLKTGPKILESYPAQIAGYQQGFGEIGLVRPEHCAILDLHHKHNKADWIRVVPDWATFRQAIRAFAKNNGETERGIKWLRQFYPFGLDAVLNATA